MPQGDEATQASRGETTKGQQVAALELETPDAITGHPLEAGVRRHLRRTDLQTRRQIFDSRRSCSHTRPSLRRQHADFARVKTNQQHLALLITEILNFVQVGSGRVTYSVTDVPACEAMQDAIELIEPLFGQKSISFDGVSGDASVVARADRARVTQILVNLLSNAMKFTPAGGHISAECAAVDDTVTLSISDTGLGIAAEKLETIFEPFVQLKEGLSDREGGIGLGLSISRDLARAMKGDLTVESTEGKGTRFTLSLPRASEDQKA